MRINIHNKSIDIEPRDVDYILPAYIKQYLFFTKNSDPDKIVFPMYASVPHPNKPGVRVPIEWVPEIDTSAIDIITDGDNVPEATEEQVAAADAKDEEIKRLRAELAELAVAKPVQGQDVAHERLEDKQEDKKERKKQKRVEITHQEGVEGLGDMRNRDPRDLIRTKQDLMDEPDLGDD